MTPELLATIRQVLTALGAAVVMFGLVKPEEVSPLVDNLVIAIGALSVVVSWAWSLWQKRLQKKAIAVATLTPVDPHAVAQAKAALTPVEVARVLSPTLPPVTVSAMGNLVAKETSHA